MITTWARNKLPRDPKHPPVTNSAEFTNFRRKSDPRRLSARKPQGAKKGSNRKLIFMAKWRPRDTDLVSTCRDKPHGNHKTTARQPQIWYVEQPGAKLKLHTTTYSGET